MSTRVKICGITRPEDAIAAAAAGADAIGLNFYSGPRKIDFPTARRIQATLPPMVTQVALVEQITGGSNATITAVKVKNELNLRTFQTYSADEQFTLASAFNDTMDWWIVVTVTSRNSFKNLRGLVGTLKSRPQGLILDTYSPNAKGGTGQAFNWNWIAEARDSEELEGLPPLILAGGLTPANVAEAVRIAQPYAVDVSSGVEVAGQPGVKDWVKIQDFIAAAKGA
ncbi:MAG: phosphoribosylanthranilate isomerase [Phycisphaerae bacterium]